MGPLWTSSRLFLHPSIEQLLACHTLDQTQTALPKPKASQLCSVDDARETSADGARKARIEDVALAALLTAILQRYLNNAVLV